MMSSSFRLPSPLYTIFDPSQNTHSPPLSVVHHLLKGGSSLIQLRIKEKPANEFLQLAVEIRRLTSQAGCLLIVNDRVDIALACGADGVHLGQEDLPLAAAKRIMGNRFIGISTHTLEQAKEAERGRAHYIGFGPIFGSMTKETGYAPRGLPMLQEIRRAVRLPIVAIGGITETNVKEVWQAGAHGAAMISDLIAEKDIAEKVRRVLAQTQSSSASS